MTNDIQLKKIQSHYNRMYGQYLFTSKKQCSAARTRKTNRKGIPRKSRQNHRELLRFTRYSNHK